jgi:hypothetical protein
MFAGLVADLRHRLNIPQPIALPPIITDRLYALLTGLSR